MKLNMKQGALALALLGGAALFAAPAVANSLHDEGDFGGGFRPYYYGAIDPYGYAPGWSYWPRH